MGLYGLWKALHMHMTLEEWKLEWADIDAQWKHVEAVKETLLNTSRTWKVLANKLEVKGKVLKLCTENDVSGRKCFWSSAEWLGWVVYFAWPVWPLA
jgi:hypothetical protein